MVGQSLLWKLSNENVLNTVSKEINTLMVGTKKTPLTPY